MQTQIKNTVDNQRSGDAFVRQTELDNCVFVKTVLMLIVVIYHGIIYWTGTWFPVELAFSSEILSLLSKWLNTFHIYGFALVSGYLFFYLKCECGKYGRFLPFAVNKAKRLLIPYIFVASVWVAPFAVYFFRYGAVQLIRRYVLGIFPNQLWFLLMLFGVFMIFYPISSFFEKRNLCGAAAVLCIYGVGIIGKMKIPNVYQIFEACAYIPFFWLGFKIRQYGSAFLRKIPIVVWLLTDVALFALSEFVSDYDGIFFALFKLGIAFVLHIVGALMAFVILQKLATKVNWKDSRVFSIFSKNSMPVYLFHQQIIYLSVYFLNGKLNPYLHATVNVIVALLISLSISLIMMKFKWTRLLIGEK